MSRLAEALIESVDWSAYLEATGPADGIGQALGQLLSSSGVGEASAAWEEIEEHVFSQGTIYSVAEPAAAVMLAALTEDQPSWRSGRIVDLLFFIAQGTSTADPGLQDRCRDRIREGLWLLARRALTHDGWARDNALEVLELVAPERVGVIRAAMPTT
jgi:hypothetical protein